MKINISNRSKIIISITFLLCLLYIMFHKDIEFRSNKYGLSEIKVLDYIFSIHDKYDDGPYTLIEEKELVEKTIRAGKATFNRIPLKNELLHFSDELSAFKNVKNIAALSDIHGQHDIFINILKAHDIVDAKLNWSFGDGHFVITGDIFDRGPQVLNTLWFVFHLEKQAEKNGGKVHYLLGNHEYMVLHGRVKYLHDIYLRTSELLHTEYKDLFDNNTVLGRWIRSKSTVIKINDSLFLHGGISQDFLQNKLDLDTVNRRYRESIDISRSDIKKSEHYKMLHNSSSPIWYRGYFRDGGLSNPEVDDILDVFDAARVIVGHTSGSAVRQLNNGRIYGIDSSIKKGLEGEILLLYGKQIFRGTYEGERIKLN